MVIGFEEFQINENNLKVELVDKIPDGYKFIDKQNGYEIYRKDEQIKEDTHHYYLGIKENIHDKKTENAWIKDTVRRIWLYYQWYKKLRNYSK